MLSSSTRTFGSFRLAAGVLVALLFVAPAVRPEERPCPTAQALSGTWAQEGEGFKIRFEPDRVVLRQNGPARVATVLRQEPCKLVVRDQGLVSTWPISGKERSLRLEIGKEAFLLSPSPGPSPDLDVTPLRLPPLKPVPPERVKEISANLVERVNRDQAVINDPPNSPRTAAVIADNLRYLKGLVMEVGWIDISRFGKPAAAAATLIAKHGEDLPLMQAALPILEKDVKENGGPGEMLSVLVDGLLLTLGQKQKYGTQLALDEQGKPFVIPVEDPTKVDEYRKAIGIFSWSEYLQLASKSAYNGAPIRMPRPDE
ncbi:MAG TPA: DUF6624 domain-containing protein [Thermoanaerobaculia bacterium]|jgi:hypothetical protein